MIFYMQESQNSTTDQVIAQIWALTEPVLHAEGMELIEVEFRRESHGWVLRLYIDREEGISVDDCAQVSRTLSDLLDVTDPIDYPYHLEVSSPGLNRPLRKGEHFARFVGSTVEIRTRSPVMERRNFKGTLEKVTSHSIHVNCDSVPYEISLENLDKARLKYFQSGTRGEH